MRVKSTGFNTVLDHRGRERSLFTATGSPGGRADLPRDKLRRYRRAAVLPAADFSYLAAGPLELFILLPGWVIGFFAVRSYLIHDLPMALFMAGPALWVIVRAALLGTKRSRVQARANTVVATMLKDRHCPSCAYPLEGLRPDSDDGCIVCPECGGAWRLP